MTEEYSVVIPAYNAAKTLEEALSSILGQSPPPAEIIVVDDGSTDATIAVARRIAPSAIVTSQTNQGCGAATNVGILMAASPILAFLDADDIWLPGKAAAQLRFLGQSPEAAGIFSRAQTFKGPLPSEKLGQPFDLWSRTTMMIRADAARQIGPMIDPPGGRGDTIDWIARGRELGLRLEILPDVLAMRRIRPGSLSYGRDSEKDRGYLHTVRRALERKREIERMKNEVPDGE